MPGFPYESKQRTPTYFKETMGTLKIAHLSTDMQTPSHDSKHQISRRQRTPTFLITILVLIFLRLKPSPTPSAPARMVSLTNKRRQRTPTFLSPILVLIFPPSQTTPNPQRSRRGLFIPWSAASPRDSLWTTGDYYRYYRGQATLFLLLYKEHTPFSLVLRLSTRYNRRTPNDSQQHQTYGQIIKIASDCKVTT